MKQTAIKIFLACFIGAFIGTLVAMHSGIFWVAGLLVGGLVGYLSYEFKEVIRVVKIVFRETTIAFRNTGIWVFSLRPNWGIVKRKGRFFFLMVVRNSSFVSVVVPPVVTMLYLLNRQTVRGSVGEWAVAIILITALAEGMVLFFSIIAILAGDETWSVYFTNSNHYLESGDITLKRAVACNFFSVYFYFIPFKVIPAIIKRSYFSIKLLWEVCRKTFIVIHSEIRLLCGADAMLGTLIGYFYWNPLLGALAGGLLGVASYYFVSVKLLKLAPISSQK